MCVRIYVRRSVFPWKEDLGVLEDKGKKKQRFVFCERSMPWDVWAERQKDRKTDKDTDDTREGSLQ